MFSKEFKRAFSLSLPTLFAYFPLGLLFGVLFTQTQFHWLGAPLMSALLYAGAAQFVVLSMLSNHAGLFAILCACLFISLRNIFYGISVGERLNHAPSWMKPVLMFGLVDANYAIFTNYPPDPALDDIKFCFILTLLMYSYWVIGTLIGAIFASMIPNIESMGFILTAFFFLISIQSFKKNASIDIFVVPSLFAILTYQFSPNYYLLITIAMASIYLYLKVRFFYE